MTEGAGPDAPRVGAVVVARERVGSLTEVLEALAGQTRTPDETLIVDNDATPAVREAIEAARRGDDRVQVLRLDWNHGGAGGFSAGIARLGERTDLDYVWVFDDDAVPESGCLEALLAEAPAHERLGAIGAASVDETGELAWSLNVPGRSEPMRSLADLERVAGGERTVPVMELAWHALLIPTSTVRAVGPPRADLFTWYEDVEYGLRLRTAGLGLYVTPGTRVRHPRPPRTLHLRFLGVPIDVPMTNASRSYLLIRNSLVVRRAYAGRRFWYADLPLTLVRALALAFKLPGPRLGVLRGVLGRALADAVRGRMGPPPEVTARLDD